MKCAQQRFLNFANTKKCKIIKNAQKTQMAKTQWHNQFSLPTRKCQKIDFVKHIAHT